MRALDLFSGTGWGVACQQLGIEELGIDNNWDVIDTREANGMLSVHADILKTENMGGMHEEILIASPPCPTFSRTGNRKGFLLLQQVCKALEKDKIYLSMDAIRRFGQTHDPRTALVMAPLSFIAYSLPKYVALEQVETVLPVWESYARVMRLMGYNVETGILNAEQYGVPQSRKRAFLVASTEQRANLPEPTHSKYHVRNPYRMDHGVLPWVSMAEALGIASDEIENKLFCPTNLRPHSGIREAERPASTLAFGHENARWITRDEYDDYIENGTPQPGIKLTHRELAVLQSYPDEFIWKGGKTSITLQISNAVPPLLAEAVLRELIS